jgi:hypothetical protein
VIRGFAFLCLLAAGAAMAAKDPLRACPDFPAPKKAKLQVVADQMDFNGIPMSVRRIESEAPPEDILAFYRKLWAATEKIRGPEEYPLGPWQVIASLRDNCFYTVQVKPFGKNGTEGFLGLTAPPSGKTVKEELPKLPGSTVLNDISHNDAGKTARTVVLTNGFSPAANADFYRRNLGDQGWRVTNHYRLEQPNQNGDVMVLKNGLRELSITMTRQGRESNVLLNYVDQP